MPVVLLVGNYKASISLCEFSNGANRFAGSRQAGEHHWTLLMLRPLPNHINVEVMVSSVTISLFNSLPGPKWVMAHEVLKLSKQ